MDLAEARQRYTRDLDEVRIIAARQNDDGLSYDDVRRLYTLTENMRRLAELVTAWAARQPLVIVAKDE